MFPLLLLTGGVASLNEYSEALVRLNSVYASFDVSYRTYGQLRDKSTLITATVSPNGVKISATNVDNRPLQVIIQHGKQTTYVFGEGKWVKEQELDNANVPLFLCPTVWVDGRKYVDLYNDRLVSIESAKKVTWKDHDCYCLCVRVEAKQGSKPTRSHFYFDANTWACRGIEGEDGISDYYEYRDENGLPYLTRAERFSGGRLLFGTEIVEIRPRTAASDAEFVVNAPEVHPAMIALAIAIILGILIIRSRQSIGGAVPS
jgi:hypothetical protein